MCLILYSFFLNIMESIILLYLKIVSPELHFTTLMALCLRTLSLPRWFGSCLEHCVSSFFVLFTSYSPRPWILAQHIFWTVIIGCSLPTVLQKAVLDTASLISGTERSL